MKRIIAESSERQLGAPKKHHRYLYHSIDWNNRLIGIKGMRGAGKTTLLLQYLVSSGKGSAGSVYLSLDDLYFTSHTLLETVRSVQSEGGEIIVLDEVDAYPGWALEISTLHEQYPDLQIIFSISSVTELSKESKNLSQNTKLYELHGLSYREYLHFSYDIRYDRIDVTTLLERSRTRQSVFPSDFRPVRYFNEYLQQGYFPYCLDNNLVFDARLQKSVRKTVECDMAGLKGFDVRNAKKMLRLLGIIAGSVPFKPNVSKLADECGIHRNSLVPYLHYLEQAGLIHLLYPSESDISSFQKPEQVYLSNPNLAWFFNTTRSSKENLRKTYVLSHLIVNYSVNQPASGDISADNEYTFRIENQSHPDKQISALDPVQVVTNHTDSTPPIRIPLWMFGLLY